MKKVTQHTKYFKIKGQKPEVLTVAAIFLLLCAYGIGLSVKNILKANSYDNNPTVVTKQTEPISQPEVNIKPPPQEPIYTYTPVEIPQEQYTPPVVIEPQPPAAPQMNIVGDNLTQEQITQMQGAMAMMQNMQDFFQNLTPEQQTKIQNRMMQMQSLSAEDQVTMQSSMMQLGQRVMSMPAQQQQQAMGNVMQQMQQWMLSDQDGLPEFSLD